MGGRTWAAANWTVSDDALRRRGDLAQYHATVDRWLRALAQTPLPLPPALAAVRLGGPAFAAHVALHRRRDERSDAPPRQSLYYSEDVSEHAGACRARARGRAWGRRLAPTGGRFHAMLADRVGRAGTGLPPLFPLLEATVRRHTHTHFVDAYMMLALQAARVQLGALSVRPTGAFVDSVVFGQRLFLHARLAPVPAANGTARWAPLARVCL
jgi:hypothetical protein